MATDASENIWQNFFQQQGSIVSLLDSHASLLVQLREHCAGSTAALEAIQARLLSTETLIAGFKSSAESLRSITNQEDFKPTDSSSLPRPKPSISTERTTDPSGLFTFDTNPSIVSDMLKANTTPKRKMNSQGHDADGTTENQGEPKRPRLNGHDEQEASEEDDSFVRGVEARVQAKANRKKERFDKKRKRQSDSSMTSANNGQQNKRAKHEGKSPANKPLEIRQNHNGKRSQSASNSSRTQSGRPNKKRRK
ncbi:hypothetical protein LTR99_004339 [Exophiala xenobiotica]|uniref:Uncharacterized protein n=1 Tax=Vermiconidia calcicola TaxID=1690605 RepID=A0AAV9QE31_9PEZI|nr:hypothetical protein LTR96_001555 [Exophiala xenobiotica]KAK5537926.1 hypothetical protein LTR23_007386 [Chaetothyriales sp. CCFEE 6169]KAK5539620.1 hypothetical protein LTR25_003324 [Vermiconidia calcicola]KAK5303884.1 hypothetical protein LTR99_004339 [Exophiala xenobiotica]KAK5338495.1 hypothetical protein LTR98_004894 [Exophiala xenobiotica]